MKYLRKVKELALTFNRFGVQQIPKEENSGTNMLAKVVTMAPMVLPQDAYFETIRRPTTKEPSMVMQADNELC